MWEVENGNKGRKENSLPHLSSKAGTPLEFLVASGLRCRSKACELQLGPWSPVGGAACLVSKQPVCEAVVVTDPPQSSQTIYLQP